MNKQTAKDLSIEVWQYIFDHPEIEYKNELPPYLYRKIRNLVGRCPLCEYWDLYDEKKFNRGSCVLNCCSEDESSLYDKSSLYHNSLYHKWRNSEKDKDRKKYSGQILDKIKGWEIK